MARAKRVDGNQPKIVKEFRDYGVSVGHLHMVGQGFPDVCVGLEGVSIIGDIKALESLLEGLQGFKIVKGVNLLIEIKDDSQPPSKRKLTEPEQDWHDTWKGQVSIVENAEDVKNLLTPLTKKSE